MAQPVPLDAARLNDLKQVIDGYLRSSNTFGQIRQLIAQHAQQEPGVPPSVEELMDVVQERGILTSLIRSLQQEKPTPLPAMQPAAPPIPKAHHRYLHVKLLGGRAFLDHLDTDLALPGPRQETYMCLLFGAQRLQSRSVPCVCDPAWDDDFLVDLDAEKASSSAAGLPLQGNRDLLRLNQPLQLVVMKRDPERQVRHYVGENAVEWRKVLRTGVLSVSVELGGGTAGLKVPLGLLELQIELIPGPTSKTTVLEEDIVAQINAERTNKTAAEREFLVYARRWWEEYHALSKDHAARIVKVFAQLSAATQVMLPVTSWVTPMTAPRLLDSPHHAARFVALMGCEDDAGTTSAVTHGGTAGSDSWLSTHAFLLKGKAPVCNHAVLLCNFLLGFGLDAYVVIGREENGPHVWVLTRAEKDVVFWESTTGSRYAHGLDGRPVSHKYTHVGCVFNDACFYANVQPSDEVQYCSFDLDDEAKWKPMSTMKMKLIRKQPRVPVCGSAVDPVALEELLEASLMKLVHDHRDALGLTCAWNPEFSYVLTQVLCGYEQEKCYGVVADSRYFEAAVRASVRDGYTFKGYPMHFTHGCDRRIFHSLLQSRTCKDILETVGQVVTFFVRVKCFVYPEDVLSVWVMLAVRYKGAPPT
eukprot:EG_transcript_5303